MTAEQRCEYLLTHSKLFERSVIRDTDQRGNDFCEMVIKNPNIPTLPITVTVTDLGCSLSVGQIHSVTSSDKMTPDEVLSAIEDVMNDKILFLVAYKEGEDVGFGAPYLTRVFALTGGDDDMTEDYERFVRHIQKPIKKLFRPIVTLKGSFRIFNFSGSVDQAFTR